MRGTHVATKTPPAKPAGKTSPASTPTSPASSTRVSCKKRRLGLNKVLLTTKSVKLAALALAGAVGCSQDPAGLQLVFPSEADKMAATHATIYTLRGSAGTDLCPNFIQPLPAMI